MKVLRRTRQNAAANWHPEAWWDARRERLLKRLWAIAKRRGVAPIEPFLEWAKGRGPYLPRAQVRVPSRLSVRRAGHSKRLEGAESGSLVLSEAYVAMVQRSIVHYRRDADY